MNNKAKELLEKLRQIQRLRSETAKLKNELSKEYSPYQEGDITAVVGWLHKGKKCRIEKIHLEEDYEEADGIVLLLSVTARVLRKDGSDSQHFVNWSSHNDKALEDAMIRLFLDAKDDKTNALKTKKW